MALRDDLNAAVKDAMRAKDQRRLSTLRMVQAAIKDRDIAARTETSREGVADEEILSLLGKMIKQREDSVTAYEAGGRPELAQAEREEIAVIREYLPAQMDDEAIKAAISAAIAATGAASMKDMGVVIAHLKERFTGKMDFAKASGQVKALLGGK